MLYIILFRCVDVEKTAEGDHEREEKNNGVHLRIRW